MSRASSAISVSPALKSSTPMYAKRFESGASLSKVITGTPCATASSIAGVSSSASEQDSNTASTPSLIACAMRSACTLPLSCGGVSHSISMARWSCAPSSRARVSAPRRAATNDGLVALLAIIAMRSGRWGAVAVAGVGGIGSVAAASRRPVHVPSVASDGHTHTQTRAPSRMAKSVPSDAKRRSETTVARSPPQRTHLS